MVFTPRMTPSALKVYEVLFYLYPYRFIIYCFSLNQVINYSFIEMFLHVEIMTEGKKRGLLWFNASGHLTGLAHIYTDHLTLI